MIRCMSIMRVGQSWRGQKKEIYDEDPLVLCLKRLQLYTIQTADKPAVNTQLILNDGAEEICDKYEINKQLS